MPSIEVLCSFCKKTICRSPSAVSKVHNFCNHHCAASFTNSVRVTKLSSNKQFRKLQSSFCKRKNCPNQIGIENILYCSNRCRKASYLEEHAKFKHESVMRVKEFVEENGRLPVKREFSIGYRRIIITFKSWNNLIKSAGFDPNPVMFSHKHIANDGHKCDSLSEKIVDDWLFTRGIPHLVKVKYPWNNGMTADFKAGKYWIELFGLCGQLVEYDNLMKTKLQKVKEHKLCLISLFLSDLFPYNRLEDKLNILQKNTRYL